MKYLLLLVLLLSCVVLAQTRATTPSLQELEVTRNMSYFLAPVNSSGVSGNLQAAQMPYGGTQFSITLKGSAPGARYAAVLYQGSCGPDREEVLSLESVSNIPEDPYASVTRSTLDYQSITNGDYFLYVFAGEVESPVIACGEVGLGANAEPAPKTSTPLPSFTTVNLANNPIKVGTDTMNPTANMSINTVSNNVTTASNIPSTSTAIHTDTTDTQAVYGNQSYFLAPVAGSGVSGNMQVSGDVGGGSRIVVSLRGVNAGMNYPLVLYEGNCGPDREQFAVLSPVGSIPGDAYSSITQTSIPFDMIANGDHFLYVFVGEEGGQIAACGEVGLGANRY